MVAIRDMFPFFKHHKDVAYFDNAATMLKPQAVIDAVVDYYERLSANIHRGDYTCSLETSQRYEAVRQSVAAFLNSSGDTIVFTSGASESLNLVAHGYGHYHLHEGDVVLLNESEHASNILPWFALSKEKGIVIEFIPLDAQGRITLEALKGAMHAGVKLVTLAHISNVLGYQNDIAAMAKIVHEYDALFCVDGAQAVGHIAVDVQALDVDFYAFSAHKMMGPTGVGVLYGKAEHLALMNPISTGGGNNIRFNTCGSVELKQAPAKFESGTPNIEGVLGFGAALETIKMLRIETFETIIKPLHQAVLKGLMAMEHVTVYNPHADTGIVSFSVAGIFAQDVAAYLNAHNISVRSGEHCAKMLNGVLHMEKSIRLSLYIYNTMAEVQRFLAVMETITLEKTIDLYL